MLPAWFGKLEFDKQENLNPWTRQLVDDIKAMNIVEGWEDIHKLVEQDPLIVFKDVDIMRNIIDFDTKHLRATLLDKLDHVFVNSCEGKVDTPTIEHVCQIITPEGVCGYVAKSAAALKHHEVLSGRPNHDCRSVVNLITITNQCPLCSSCFVDIATTQHHLMHAISSGKCQADRGYKIDKPDENIDLVCPFSNITCDDKPVCEFECETLSELQRHIVKHIEKHLVLDQHMIVMPIQHSLEFGLDESDMRDSKRFVSSSAIAPPWCATDTVAEHNGQREWRMDGWRRRRASWASVAAHSAPSSWFKHQGGAHTRTSIVENAGLECSANEVERLCRHVDHPSTLCVSEDSASSSKGFCNEAQRPISAQVRLPPCPGMEEFYGLTDYSCQECGEGEQEREIGRCHQHHECCAVDLRNRWAEARTQAHPSVQDQTMSRRNTRSCTLCSQPVVGESTQSRHGHTPRDRSSRGFCVAWYSPPKRVGETGADQHRCGESHVSKYVNEVENENNNNKYDCKQPSHMGSNSDFAVLHVDLEGLNDSQVSEVGAADRESENNETVLEKDIMYDLKANPPKFQIAVRTSANRIEDDKIDKPMTMLHARSSNASTMWDLHATTSKRMAKYYEDGLIAAPTKTKTKKKSESSEKPLTRAKSLPNIISMLNLVEGGVGPQSVIQLKTNKRNRAKGKAKAKAKSG